MKRVVIDIVLGGYLDENRKLMTRPELDKAITDMKNQIKELSWKAKRYDMLQPAITRMTGWSNFKNYCLNIMK